MEYIEKILTALALPPGGLIALALLGLALARHWWRAGSLLIVCSLLGLWLLATPVVSDALKYSLESRFPAQALSELPAGDVIVVLGGGLQAPHSRNPYPDLGAAADRYWHAFRLWRAGKAPEILISGGTMPWMNARGSEAEAAVGFLGELGVPARRIIIESQSLNTRQNASLSARILRGRGATRILLVTSALHMPRALEQFRGTGLDVVPAAIDHEVRDDPRGALRWLPDTNALDGSRRALKEYLGYWVQR